MTDNERRKAAREFAEYWKDKGYEKGEGQKFWLSLLGDVLGVEDPKSYIEFEVPVKLNNTGKGFIDGLIDATHVLIEQKGRDKDLLKPAKQSDGSLQNPYHQAKRYVNDLPHDRKPRWIITCNFREFHIYDMNNPHGDPEKILLSELEKEYYRLQFIVKENSLLTKKEETVSVEAGRRVGKIYDALLAQYKDPDEESLRSLNMLCVRLVFCLYAEDSGLFGSHTMFHDYLKELSVKDVRRGLIDLFKVLDTPMNERDKYIDDDLGAFPYVNGGLFANENIEIPNFTQEIVDLILEGASEDFDWSSISPTIFGAVFESTLNPETRRSGGMHYTSIENIHKVIDPLFLNDLREELDGVLEIKVTKTREAKLEAFRDKLSKLTFLDPACGSGNFLTETFVSLRRLENEALRGLTYDQVLMDFGDTVKVHIDQFYGIEINDFAVSVAKTALWIAEHQMLKETAEILERNIDFLPLKSYVNIVEGNALRIDWATVVPKDKLNYIMGNPPFVGSSFVGSSIKNIEEQQKEDKEIVFEKSKAAGKLDYVACWYKKAFDYIDKTNIEVAFVSTNSITQGEQVRPLWEPLLSNGLFINFAYRTFQWDSEANNKANVHCVIICVSRKERKNKIIFVDGLSKAVLHINGYLIDAPDFYIESRCHPPSWLPKLTQGSKPWDDGGLILSSEERNILVHKYPQLIDHIKLFYGSREFINNMERYCLWFVGVSPSVYRNIPEIKERLQRISKIRRESPTIAVQEQAKSPMLFSQIRQPKNDYILVPETSSQTRCYIPMGFMSKDVIASNSTLTSEKATLYMFGVMQSIVHMHWVRTLCGRMKSDYRYSPALYNNFPWPNVSDEQKKEIEETALGIIDARNLYPDSSLSDLYDDSVMPIELRKAHEANDKAVAKAYGLNVKTLTESVCVSKLMNLYQEEKKLLQTLDEGIIGQMKKLLPKSIEENEFVKNLKKIIN